VIVAPNSLMAVLQKEKLKRRAEASFAEFVRQAWPIIEPGVPYIESWHIDVICEHLEAVHAGEIRRLLINIPPRHSKSTIVSVMFPAWEWIDSPEQKFLCASYSGKLAVRDNVKTRRLIQSPWYQERWGNQFHLTGDQNAKERFENDHTGYRIATSVGGTATGEGGSRLFLDDPHGAQDAQSDAMRSAAIEWYNTVWSTRLNSPKTDAMVTIMQRLHEGDVSGVALKEAGWEHVCIPAEYDGVKRKTVLGNYDPRTKKGSLICPERFGPDELARLKTSLGEYGTSGQLQQQPSPPGGGILKTKHFQLWRGRLPDLDFILQSYDTAFSEETKNDPSACTVWGCFTWKEKKCAILLDAWDEQLSYPKLRKRVVDDWKATYAKDEKRKGWKPDAILVEKKASGQSILQDLQASNIPAHSYEPGRSDKVQRAHNVAPILEMDVLYILESEEKPREYISWAKDFVDQVSKFPNAEHDDYVDTLTQAIVFLRDARYFDLPYFAGDPVEEKDYYAEKRRKVNPYTQ
jgi:predicted phage terminase large subunit-like protein